MADSKERKDAGVDAGTSGSQRTVDWGGQDEYWRDRYEYYQPAYKYGHESAFFYGGRAWDSEVEHDLERGWDQARGESTCSWLEVKDAVREAYERTRTHSTAA